MIQEVRFQSVSGTIHNASQNGTQKIKLKNLNNWDDLDEEEKFTELLY